MGQLLGNLTQPNSALADPNTGAPQMVGSQLLQTNPDQAMLERNRDQLNAGTPPQMTIGANGQASFSGPKPYNTPQAMTPSFSDAAQAGAMPGSANVMSPGLNKAGKLVTLLTSGLQGALAGRAANEQATVQSGGRRSGGIGMAMESGYNLPFQRAQVQQELQKGQAQTELLQAQSQMVPTPYGQMPAGLAKLMFPAMIRAQGQKDVQEMKGDTAENVAGINKRYQVVPNVGLFDTQSRTLVPQTEQGITITPEIAKDHELPQQFIGKPMSLQQLAGIQRSEVFGTVPVMGAAGPALVNRKTAAVTPLGLGSPGVAAAQARPTQIAVQNSPGNTKFVSGGQAIESGAAGPQSASVQVPKKAMTAEVPTKIGDLKVAFTTAIQHAQLLRQASQSLNNGDVQALSGLKNSFKNAFGYEGPITAQAIADAYGREVTSMLSKGHMTDSEISSVGKTINPSRQNYQQLDSVLGAYQSLAQSKMNMLNQQKNAAVNASQPGKPGKQPSSDKVIRYKIQNGQLVPE